MKTRIKRPLCLGVALTLLIGLLLFPASADGAMTKPETVGYSADRITTTMPDGAVDILDLSADGSDYAAATATDFYIADAAGLKRLSEVTNAGKTFSGKTVWLKNDIDMSGVTNFEPIGDSATADSSIDVNNAIAFCGTFDGCGHRIIGLTVTSSTRLKNALFGTVRNAIIRNLVIDSSCSFSYTGSDGNARIAAVVATVLVVANDTLLAADDYKNIATLIDNVWNQASVTGVQGRVGGILAGGSTKTNASRPCVYNSTNSGTVTASQEHAGGVIGRSDNTLGGLIIDNVLNTGNIYAKKKAGGIYGDNMQGRSSDSPLTIRNCVNRGDVCSQGEEAGGIVGILRFSTSEISNCKNYGNVESKGTTAAAKAGYCCGDYAANATEAANVTNFTNYRFAGVMLHGYQLGNIVTGEDNVRRRAVRLVASVDSLEYGAVGFRVEATYQKNGATKTQTLEAQACRTVYSSLTAVGDAGETELTAEDLRGTGYLYALVLENLDVTLENLQLTVTPYFVKDGNEPEGTAVTFTVALQ